MQRSEKIIVPLQQVQQTYDQHIEDILISRKVQPTAMRVLVLDFLLKQKAAASLSDIEGSFARSDRVTIYRTLKTFEKKGLIHSIQDGAVTKYAICQNDCNGQSHQDTHLHFYCTRCKETVCLPAVKIPGITVPGNYMIAELSLIARGVCGKCSDG